MKTLYYKDVNFRKHLKKKELFTLWCKSSFLQSVYSSEIKAKIVFNFFLISENIFVSKVRNRCFFSKRGRGILSDFGLSRIKFREFSSFGLLNGIRKGSW